MDELGGLLITPSCAGKQTSSSVFSRGFCFVASLGGIMSSPPSSSPRNTTTPLTLHFPLLGHSDIKRKKEKKRGECMERPSCSSELITMPDGDNGIVDDDDDDA